jgi:hypothetical protein
MHASTSRNHQEMYTEWLASNPLKARSAFNTEKPVQRMDSFLQEYAARNIQRLKVTPAELAALSPATHRCGPQKCRPAANWKSRNVK